MDNQENKEPLKAGQMTNQKAVLVFAGLMLLIMAGILYSQINNMKSSRATENIPEIKKEIRFSDERTKASEEVRAAPFEKGAEKSREK